MSEEPCMEPEHGDGLWCARQKGHDGPHYADGIEWRSVWVESTDVACPKCQAAPGTACTSVSGARRTYAHDARCRVARRATEAPYFMAASESSIPVEEQ